MTALRDKEAAGTAARRLQALAEDLARQPAEDVSAAMVVNAFRGAARALESAGDPPSRRQVLALVQVLTAGFEKLLAEPLAAAAGVQANDAPDSQAVPRARSGGSTERLRITLWTGTDR